MMTPNVNGQSGCDCIIDSNVGSFGTEGVTDGTSNTAAISEKLAGTASFGNSSGASTITASNRNMALRGMFATSLTINIDAGATGPAGPSILPDMQCHSRYEDLVDL